MKSYVVDANDAGRRLDRFVQKMLPQLPGALLQKYIRIKRIKVNRGKTQNAYLLREGDVVDLYISDEFFSPVHRRGQNFMAAGRELRIVFEDENLLVADKPAGLVVHEDEEGTSDTLINRILRYLFESGQYDPALNQSFAPALCNRIDRNTGGLVLAAKNAATLRVVNRLLKDRRIKKFYLCVAVGEVRPEQATLRHYLLRDLEQKSVRVFDAPTPGARTALTRYRVLRQKPGKALLEVELLTGRTHQIRAQMAHAGFPLLGDSKYGRAPAKSHQALCAWRIIFDAGGEAEHLAYLNGRVLQAAFPPFALEFGFSGFDGKDEV